MQATVKAAPGKYPNEALPGLSRTSGLIGIRIDPGSTVRFRNLEIMELNPSK